MKPFFSVVIPTYNRADKLERALKSVLCQTYKNFEILVMDNGSTDNTHEIVASFSDPRIKYEWDENSGGPARPRNRGIALAKSEWICFLDSDDWWMADKLQACFDCINDKVDLIYHDLEIVSDNPRLFSRKKIMTTWQVKAPVLVSLLLKGNPIINSSVVARKSLLDKIGGIDESVEMIAAEDYNAWLHIAQLTDQFVYLQSTLGCYLIHNQCLSQKNMSIPWRSAANAFSYLLNEQQRIKLEANFRYTSGRFNSSIGDYRVAKEDLLFAMQHGYLMLKVKSTVFLLALFGKKIFWRERI